ncbi:MAG: hypothetical protein D3914_03720 [Candidatus Electrothrix sp. LOE2]|nr:hypothetical protein [Candidatus Electrothrix sp. LOE2]
MDVIKCYVFQEKRKAFFFVHAMFFRFGTRRINSGMGCALITGNKSNLLVSRLNSFLVFLALSFWHLGFPLCRGDSQFYAAGVAGGHDFFRRSI